MSCDGTVPGGHCLSCLLTPLPLLLEVTLIPPVVKLRGGEPVGHIDASVRGSIHGWSPEVLNWLVGPWLSGSYQEGIPPLPLPPLLVPV